jgi:uncharacterized integral membrane protein
MTNRFIELQEKYFENMLTPDEEAEFAELLSLNKNLKEEFEEQKKIKEALNKMRFKNPDNEIWDGYWQNIYNRLERKFAWAVLAAGLFLLLIFAAYNFIDEFLFKDFSTPLIVKIGIALSIAGGLVLIISVIREKIFTFKNDKYKEIQR